MASDKDNNSSITTKCSFCGQEFSKVQDCLKHELIGHHLQKRNKRHSKVQKRINATVKYLNSPDKLEERTQLRENLKKTKKGEELRTVFELFCMKTDCLGLIFTRIQTCLEKHFRPPGVVKIYSFGSIASGLALRDCDIDIFLDASNLTCSPTHKRYNENVEDIQSHQRTAFNYINKLLHRSPHFSDVFAIRQARVPIIKCKHKNTGFSIDINISHPNSIENTQFIYDLIRSNDKIHELMLFLKLWAKNMQIIGRANMSSYCLVTMIIFCLQQPRNDGQRILKSLKELQEHCPVNIVQGVNYAYNLSCNENIPKIPTDVSTWDLIKEFFDFYKNFNYDDTIISPYYGKAIEKTNLTPDLCNEYYKQLRTITQYSQGEEAKDLQIDRCMCVQDVFCLNQNTARTVLPQSKEYFLYCIKNAHKICTNPKNRNLPELYEELLFETLKINILEEEAEEPTETQEEIRNLHLNSDKTEAANYNDKLIYTLTPSKADLRTLLANTDDLKETEAALQKWCQHYIEAIEKIMTKLYRVDMQKQLPFQQKQLKLDNEDDNNNLNRSWFISCSVDLWTNRQFQKHVQTSFIAFQLEQTERLHNLRRQDPNFSVTISAILKLNVVPNYKGIDIQFDLPEDVPISSLHKKSPLRKFFNMFKNTLQNYNLKEALQCNISNWINSSANTKNKM